MNKIEKLLEEFCPQGVEFRALGEVGSFLRGRRFVKTDIVKEGVPCIHYGEMYTHYNIWTEKSKSFLKPELAKKLRVAQPGDVVIVAAGETIEDIGKGVAWLGNSDVVVHDACFIFRHNLNPKYISFFLQTNQFHSQIKRHISSGKISSINAKGLEKAIIPIPPLTIQKEIVKILDNFTQLEAELEAELEARKKQYEYYREQLLMVNDEGLMVDGTKVEFRALGEVADVTKLAGFEFTKHIQYSDKGKIIALRGLNIKNGDIDLTNVKYIDDSDFAKLSRSKLYINDMLFTYVGTIGKVALINENNKYYLAPNVARIRFTNGNLNSKFMRFYFQSFHFTTKQINRYLSSSSLKNLTMTNIRKFQIPIPPLAKQQEIVAILDKFDALVNDISTGLPAEIVARKKQYEYYRNQLLNFKPLEAQDAN